MCNTQQSNNYTLHNHTWGSIRFKIPIIEMQSRRKWVLWMQNLKTIKTKIQLHQTNWKKMPHYSQTDQKSSNYRANSGGEERHRTGLVISGALGSSVSLRRHNSIHNRDINPSLLPNGAVLEDPTDTSTAARPGPHVLFKRAYTIRGGDGLADRVLSLPNHLLESCPDRGRRGRLAEESFGLFGLRRLFLDDGASRSEGGSGAKASEARGGVEGVFFGVERCELWFRGGRRGEESEGRRSRECGWRWHCDLIFKFNFSVSVFLSHSSD